MPERRAHCPAPVSYAKSVKTASKLNVQIERHWDEPERPVPRVPARPMKTLILRYAVAISVLCSMAQAGSATERVRIVAHFTPGEVLHYQFEIRTNASTHGNGPIVDPQGASQLQKSASVLVRLEVLRVESASPDSTGRVRLRATYEKSEVISQSDALDPQEVGIEEQYRKLQGHSIEFTLESDGLVHDVSGLDDILKNPAAAADVSKWLAGMTFASSAPRRAIAIGEKWSFERPVPGAPLAGLAWRAESTYLRDEPCRPALPAASASSPGNSAASPSAPKQTETCAIILTRLQMLPPNRDPTPEDYRKKGLRTSGKWIGKGENLSAISLTTGLAVSVTETGTEEMDFTVATATGQSRLHYTGKVHTESVITLLPESQQPQGATDKK